MGLLGLLKKLQYSRGDLFLYPIHGIADGHTKDHFKLGFRRNFFFVSRTIRRGIIIVLLASSHLQKNEFTPVSLINIIRYVNLRHVGSDPVPVSSLYFE